MSILELLGFKVSSSKLKQRAQDALGSFTKVMNDLKEVNQMSEERQIKLREESNKLQQEIVELNSIVLSNDKVIGNIEKILK